MNPVEQALLLAALLEAGADALDRVRGGDRCRRALEEVRALPAGARRQIVAGLSRELFSPLPPGARSASPLLQQALAGLLAAEPAQLAALLARTLPPRLAPANLPATCSQPPAAVMAALCRAVLAPLAENSPAGRTSR